MFGLFKRGPGGGGEKPSLDAVRFDTTGYASQGEPQPGKVRVWHTPEGDGLGVYFSPVPPDLPANAPSVEELAAFYHRLSMAVPEWPSSSATWASGTPLARASVAKVCRTALLSAASLTRPSYAHSGGYYRRR